MAKKNDNDNEIAFTIIIFCIGVLVVHYISEAVVIVFKELGIKGFGG